MKLWDQMAHLEARVAFLQQRPWQKAPIGYRALGAAGAKNGEDRSVAPSGLLELSSGLGLRNLDSFAIEVVRRGAM